MNSSFLNLPSNKFYNTIYSGYFFLSAIMNPIWWLLDKNIKTILDVGCGQGYPMRLLKAVKPDLEATGVDLFEDYLKEARKSGIYKDLIPSNIKKLPFKDKSFDCVICLQVIEHLDKNDGLSLLKELERVAKRQVIVTTPLGFIEHPEMDGNKLQKHLSGWYDEDFSELGYKTKHQGFSILFGNNGLVHKSIPKFLKGILFTLDLVLMPLVYVIPFISDYWVIAYKRLGKTNA